MLSVTENITYRYYFPPGATRHLETRHKRKYRFIFIERKECAHCAWERHHHYFFNFFIYQSHFSPQSPQHISFDTVLPARQPWALDSFQHSFLTLLSTLIKRGENDKLQAIMWQEEKKNRTRMSVVGKSNSLRDFV